MGFDPVSYLMGKEAGGGGGVTPADNGKVVVNGALVSQTAHAPVTENGTIDTTTNNSVTVNVQPPAPIEPSDVNFFDYDGTILYAYTAAEFAQLTEMPANPTHTGWTSQGWNWTLTDAQAYVASYGFLDIGQMYVPTDGKTHIHFTLDSTHLKPYLGFGLVGTAKINWCDGSEEETVTGSSAGTLLKIPHQYQTAGEHEATIELINSSSMTIIGGNASGDGSDLLGDDPETTAAANYYRRSITAVEFGSGEINFGSYALTRCAALQTVTLPTSISGMNGIGIFSECAKIRFVCIPNQITNFVSCPNCAALERVSFPRSTAGTTASSMFSTCRELESVAVPPLTTTIASNTFNTCAGLRKIAIPSGVTAIQSRALFDCESLGALTIPDTVTTIADNALAYCYELASITFESTTPPTVANSNAFTGLPTDCIIRVPQASLETYKGATNYPSSATYTYVGY